MIAVLAAAIEVLAGLIENLPLLEVTLLIVRVVVPAFVTTTLSLPVLPSAVFPNATDLRLTENAVPVPLTATVSRGVDPLCTKMMFPFWRPLAVGVNVILNAPSSPGCIVPLAGLTAYRAFVEVMLLMTRAALPVFVTATLSVFEAAITTNP